MILDVINRFNAQAYKKKLGHYISHNSHIVLTLLLIITFILYTYGIWDDSTQSLIAHDEGLYARRAKLIIDTGDWFTPFQEPHHKTIGSYWPIALTFKFFGVSEANEAIVSSASSSQQ